MRRALFCDRHPERRAGLRLFVAVDAQVQTCRHLVRRRAGLQWDTVQRVGGRTIRARRAGSARGGVPRQALHDRRFERRREFAIARLRQRRRFAAQELLEQLARTAPLVRVAPRQHVVRDLREAVDVGAAVHQLARQCFRRNVLQCPDEKARLGQPLFQRLLGVPRDSEIEQLHAARARVVHNIFGFQVAMNDAGRVRGGQRVGELAHQGDSIRRGERALTV